MYAPAPAGANTRGAGASIGRGAAGPRTRKVGADVRRPLPSSQLLPQFLVTPDVSDLTSSPLTLSIRPESAAILTHIQWKTQRLSHSAPNDHSQFTARRQFRQCRRMPHSAVTAASSSVRLPLAAAQRIHPELVRSPGGCERSLCRCCPVRPASEPSPRRAAPACRGRLRKPADLPKGPPAAAQESTMLAQVVRTQSAPVRPAPGYSPGGPHRLSLNGHFGQTVSQAGRSSSPGDMRRAVARLVTSATSSVRLSLAAAHKSHPGGGAITPGGMRTQSSRGRPGLGRIPLAASRPRPSPSTSRAPSAGRVPLPPGEDGASFRRAPSLRPM